MRATQETILKVLERRIQTIVSCCHLSFDFYHFPTVRSNSYKKNNFYGDSSEVQVDSKNRESINNQDEEGSHEQFRKDVQDYSEDY